MQPPYPKTPYFSTAYPTTVSWHKKPLNQGVAFDKLIKQVIVNVRLRSIKK